MKDLLIKSDENESCFHILKRKKKYNSCVHCAYYCAYQLSVYLLGVRFQTTLKTLLEVKYKDKAIDSHNMIINELAACIKRYNYKDYAHYKEWMLNLKASRSAADYSSEAMTSTMTDDVDLMLNNVRKLLKDKYIC